MEQLVGQVFRTTWRALALLEPLMHAHRKPLIGVRRRARDIRRLVILSMAIVTCLPAAWAQSEPTPPAGAVEPTRLSYCFPPRPKDRLHPEDYRTAKVHWKNMVEGAHFDSHYEAYLGGFMRVQGAHKRGEFVTGGFDYTLWGFPNHPRALAAVEQLSYREGKTDQLPQMRLKVPCYFQRAVEWYPDDPMPHAIYAYYLARRNKPNEARFEIWQTQRLESDKVGVSLYLAFAYIELKAFDDAAVYAKRAYAQGYPLPWLRQRLAKEGIELN